MRFYFCGQLDCPDWVLREIETLSKLSSIRVKFIVKEVVNAINSANLDIEKVTKHTSKVNFDTGSVKGAVAAFTFILYNAAKYDVPDDVLVKEIMQLGLPKETCTALLGPFAANREKLRAKLRSDTLHVNGLQDVSWRVDYILSSSGLKTVNAPSVKLQLQLAEGTHTFNVDADKFGALISELQKARDLMDLVPQS
eukprot:CAMPEP_0174253698 /NCGR_PEP_ID=MMETSP0439-20130205/3064_1 /TAXON_ID=0 /ORGANISM="Stereomyxa ramosa, Strain Chinc5" /LENGTH=195 /DNA_ID=CAMNT_0015334869 /DNA_START=15 /DNA_END=602 /DNA_ORIENTATION=-